MTSQTIPLPEVTTGDYIFIPKGTEYYYSEPSQYPTESLLTAKDSTAKVTSVVKKFDYAKPVVEQFGLIAMHSYEHVGYYVSWGSGKFADISNVTKTFEPIAKKASTTTPKQSLRQQLIPGTIWRATKEIKIMMSDSGLKVKESHSWEIGTEFTVDGKFTTYGPGYAHGLWLPVKLDGDVKATLLQLSDLKDSIELVKGVAPVEVFYIYDTATKQYYAGSSFINHNTDYTIVYKPTPAGAKVFKRLADVRLHLLSMSGYYYDLPQSWGGVPEWMSGPKAFDIPETWVVHKVDKITKTPISTDELIDTFNKSWRFRQLTVKYGSAVRQLYSHLEKKKKLDNYSSIVTFIPKGQDGLSQAEFDRIVESLSGFNKTQIMDLASKCQYAAATIDVQTAMMLKLSYTGDLDMVIIDLITMTEQLDNQ